MRFRIFPGMLVPAAILLFGACATTAEPPGPLEELESVAPEPSLSPREVVATQLRALQHNDEANRGIEIAFRFASPANRERTGPLPRFVRLLHSPLYNPMLGAAGFAVREVRTRGDLASVTADVSRESAKSVTYIFILSRQKGGEHADSWMIDAVQRVRRREPSRFQSV